MQKPAIQYSLVIDSPVGRLGVLIVNQHIQRLDYLDNTMRRRAARSAFERRVAQQLEDYFENPRVKFNLPCRLAGTPFQRRVWQALTRIPPGRTLTYGELAGKLETGARAVGNACRANPVTIIVPCHRVVASSGLGGYSGSTTGPEMERKSWLLGHENPRFQPLKKQASAPN